MKILGTGLLISLLSLSSFAQNNEPAPSNTLLWKISGNGLERPSYLFGTIHMLCKDDAFISKNLKNAILNADKVYLELDMDNMFEMLGVMGKMKMNNDTTLADLLTPEEYNKVKEYFEQGNSLLPFSMLETYKPMVATSMLAQSSMSCDQTVAMEQLIMEEASKESIEIKGLETMAYQMSIFDSIPYKIQALELLKMISAGEATNEGEKNEFDELMNAYKEQNLEKLAVMLGSSDDMLLQYKDILLNNRNKNWVAKLNKIMPGKSLVIAVGAGHLPGENGVINLLRKEGYKVEPVENKKTATLIEI